MPNWCNNSVTIHHTDEKKMQELVTAINDGRFCDHVVPMPAELGAGEDWNALHSSPWNADELQTSDAMDVMSARATANLEKYGYGGWYDFRIENWGTKWDVECRCYDHGRHHPEADCALAVVDNTDVPYGITVYRTEFDFDSAWNPPLGVYRALMEQGYYCRALYYEQGMQFAGIWDNGVREGYDLDTMTREEFHQRAPALDEHFNISADMEWNDDDESDAAHAELATLVDAESPGEILTIVKHASKHIIKGER